MACLSEGCRNCSMTNIFISFIIIFFNALSAYSLYFFVFWIFEITFLYILFVYVMALVVNKLTMYGSTQLVQPDEFLDLIFKSHTSASF